MTAASIGAGARSRRVEAVPTSVRAAELLAQTAWLSAVVVG